MYIALTKRTKLFLQSMALATIIVGLISGMAFGLLRSQTGEVQGNIISTATAGLHVSKDGVSYDQTVQGFVFSNIIPGSDPTPANGEPVYIKNAGSSPLSVILSANADIENNNGVDYTKVHIILTPVGGGAVQNLTLEQLMQAGRNGSGIALNQAVRLLPSQIYTVKIQVSLEVDAVGSSEATLRNINFMFDGLATQ